MPLDKNSYYNFYLGNCAEHYLMSELFFHGYEANKMSPDIGIDILVTNKARQYFQKEKAKLIYLQVKSTFLVNNKAVFFIKENELEFLLSDPSINTVFCFFIPKIEADPKSLKQDLSDTPWFEELEASWMCQMYAENFRDLRRNGELEVLEFKSFGFKYFWLNNAQLRKGKEEGIFVSAFNNLVKLTVQVANSVIEIDPVGAICPEISNIFYLLNGCYSQDRFNEGCFAYCHY